VTDVRAFVTALLLFGCAGEARPTETPDTPLSDASAAKRAPGDRAHIRKVLGGLAAAEGFDGPIAPLIQAAYRFDVAALAAMSEPAPLEGSDRILRPVVLARGSSNPQGFGIAGGFIGVLDVGADRAIQPFVLAPPTLRRGHFGSAPPNGVRCVSIAPRRDAPASVQGFRTSSVSREALTFLRLEGTIDSWTCLGRMERAARARARAILPGLLYAFRERAKDGGEKLVLIGPQSEWFATPNDDPKSAPQRSWGNFTRLDVPIQRGRASSALMNVTTFALSSALDASGSRNGAAVESIGYSGDPMITFSVEVVWPSDAASPEATAFAASYHPEADKIFELLELDPAGLR
jgi:hypothetical protein